MSDNSAVKRLGDLLDVLVALQMNLRTGVGALETVEALGPAKMREALAMLDDAITLTKTVIGDLEPPGVK
jgi:hypothetical protein